MNKFVNKHAGEQYQEPITLRKKSNEYILESHLDPMLQHLEPSLPPSSTRLMRDKTFEYSNYSHIHDPSIATAGLVDAEVYQSFPNNRLCII